MIAVFAAGVLGLGFDVLSFSTRLGLAGSAAGSAGPAGLVVSVVVLDGVLAGFASPFGIGALPVSSAGWLTPFGIGAGVGAGAGVIALPVLLPVGLLDDFLIGFPPLFGAAEPEELE